MREHSSIAFDPTLAQSSIKQDLLEAERVEPASEPGESREKRGGLVGNYQTSNMSASAIAVNGNYAYLGNYTAQPAELQILNIGNKALVMLPAKKIKHQKKTNRQLLASCNHVIF